jgi:hypothetical protein
MHRNEAAAAVVAERVAARIRLVRGHRVLLDEDLAQLYGVTTKALNQAVARNSDRFPPDFAFVLVTKEVAILRSQIVTSSGEAAATPQWGGRRYLPMAFTEQGVAMLSSVLRSAAAARVNVAIAASYCPW